MTKATEEATMKSKSSLLFIIILHFFCINNVVAQRLPFFTHYFDNPYLYNPAYAGYDKHSVFYLTHRQQWFGVEGAPASTQLSFHSPLGNANPLFLGGDIMNDRLGALSHTSAKFTAAYMIPLSAQNEHYIKTAFSVGIGMHTYDFGSMDVGDDAILQAAANNLTYLDGRFGFRYHNQGFNLSASLPHLFAPPSVVTGGFTEPGLDQFSRMIFSTHYRFNFSGENEKGLGFEPTVLYHYSREGTSQLEGMGVFYYRNAEQKDVFWFGGNYQQQSGIGGITGIRAGNLKLSYAYNTGGSEISAYGMGSHEVQLGFIIGKKKVMLKRKPRLRTDRDMEEVPDEALLKKHDKSREKNKKKDKKKETIPDRKRVEPDAQSGGTLNMTELTSEPDSKSESPENQFIIVGESAPVSEQKEEVPAAEKEGAQVEEKNGSDKTTTQQVINNKPNTSSKKERDYSQMDFDSFDTDKKGVIQLGGNQTENKLKEIEKPTADTPQLSSVNPGENKKANDKEQSADNEAPAWGDSPWNIENPDEQQAHLKAMHQGYYIIAGSFSTEANATKHADRLKGKGYNASVGYHTEKQYYYVYAFQAASKAEALAELQKLKQHTEFSQSWILSVNE